MYKKGKVEQQVWLSNRKKVLGKIVRFLLPNTKSISFKKETLELSHEYRDLKLDLSYKDSKKVDFSYLQGASKEEIEKTIAWLTKEIGWFHSIDLKHGLKTPGGVGWKSRSENFKFKERLKNKTVLDIGAMEGGDSFSAEMCGALVTAYDVDNFLEYDLGLNAAYDFVVKKYLDAKELGKEREWLFLNSKILGFEFCKSIRESSVNRISGSVYDLNPENGKYDIVFCFGLLYHLRHPILALDKIYSVTNEMAFINNQIYTGDSYNSNTILFYNDEWRGSYTNWFVPTPKAFIDMVSSVGFRKVEVVDISKTSISLICYK